MQKMRKLLNDKILDNKLWSLFSFFVNEKATPICLVNVLHPQSGPTLKVTSGIPGGYRSVSTYDLPDFQTNLKFKI